jgi:transposase
VLLELAMDLTDEQWAVLEPLIPKPRLRADGRGRPWRDPRNVLNGISWILKTGAPWADLPRRYPPPYQTCRRVLVRHDYHLENYTGFVHLACILIPLRHL